MPLLDVNGVEARKYILEKKIVVADFWAEWCIPCRAVDEALKRLSNIVSSPDIAFIRINIEENPDFAAEYSVLNLPTVIVFVNGKEHDRITGGATGIDVKVYKILRELLKKD